MRGIIKLLLLLSLFIQYPAVSASDRADANLYTKWKIEIGNETYSRSLTQDKRVTYVQANNGFLYALDEKGQKRWRIRTDLYSNSFKRFNGIIYTGTREGYLFALSENNGKELWRYKISGYINAPPVIVEGVIFFASSDSIVYALDIEKRTKRWTFKTGMGISSSPLVSRDGVLYIGSKDGNLYAIDSRNGNLLWKFEAKGGIVASPAISGDVVIFGSRDENLYALNRFSGELMWRFNAGSSLKFIPVIYNEIVSVISEEAILYGIEKGSGAEKWRIRLERGLNINIASSNGVIYIGIDNLYAVDIINGRISWRFNEKAKELYQMELLRLKVEGERKLTEDEKRRIRLRDYFPIDGKISSSPIIDGEDIFFATDKGYIYLVNRITGEIKWRFKTGVNTLLPPIADNESIYVAGDDNNIYAINIDSGQIRWSQGIYGEIENVRIGAKGIFVVDNNKRLYSIRRDNGEIRWSYRFDGRVNDLIVLQDTDREKVISQIDNKRIHVIDGDKGIEMFSDSQLFSPISSPIIINNRALFFSAKDGSFYALQSMTNEKRFSILWQVYLGKEAVIAPVIYNDTVFSGSADGEIFGIDREAGILTWRYNLKGIVRPYLIVSDGIIYTVLNEQFVYAIDIASKRLEWNFDGNGRINGLPVIYNGGLFIVTDSETIYEVDKKDGVIRKELKINDGISSQIVFKKDTLFYISKDGDLCALNTKWH